MTEPQTITADHLRSLLEGGTLLVLVEGGVEVIGADDADPADGGLEIITRDALVDQLGETPSDDDLAEHAAALTVAALQAGG